MSARGDDSSEATNEKDPGGHGMTVQVTVVVDEVDRRAIAFNKGKSGMAGKRQIEHEVAEAVMAHLDDLRDDYVRSRRERR